MRARVTRLLPDSSILRGHHVRAKTSSGRIEGTEQAAGHLPQSAEDNSKLDTGLDVRSMTGEQMDQSTCPATPNASLAQAVDWTTPPVSAVASPTTAPCTEHVGVRKGSPTTPRSILKSLATSGDTELATPPTDAYEFRGSTPGSGGCVGSDAFSSPSAVSPGMASRIKGSSTSSTPPWLKDAELALQSPDLNVHAQDDTPSWLRQAEETLNSLQNTPASSSFHNASPALESQGWNNLAAFVDANSQPPAALAESFVIGAADQPATFSLNAKGWDAGVERTAAAEARDASRQKQRLGQEERDPNRRKPREKAAFRKMREEEAAAAHSAQLQEAGLRAGTDGCAVTPATQSAIVQPQNPTGQQEASPGQASAEPVMGKQLSDTKSTAATHPPASNPPASEQPLLREDGPEPSYAPECSSSADPTMKLKDPTIKLKDQASTSLAENPAQVLPARRIDQDSSRCAITRVDTTCLPKRAEEDVMPPPVDGSPLLAQAKATPSGTAHCETTLSSAPHTGSPVQPADPSCASDATAEELPARCNNAPVTPASARRAVPTETKPSSRLLLELPSVASPPPREWTRAATHAAGAAKRQLALPSSTQCIRLQSARRSVPACMTQIHLFFCLVLGLALMCVVSYGCVACFIAASPQGVQATSATDASSNLSMRSTSVLTTSALQLAEALREAGFSPAASHVDPVPHLFSSTTPAPPMPPFLAAAQPLAPSMVCANAASAPSTPMPAARKLLGSAWPVHPSLGPHHPMRHSAVTLSAGANSGTQRGAIPIQRRDLSLFLLKSVPAIERDLAILLGLAKQRKNRSPRQRRLVLPSRPGAWSHLVLFLHPALLLLALGAAVAAPVLWMQKASISMSSHGLWTAFEHMSPHVLRGAKGAASSLLSVLRRLVAPIGGGLRRVVSPG